MGDAFIRRLWRLGSTLLLVSGGLAGSFYGIRGALGVLSGGFWNLINLWCLQNLLNAWLGTTRSTRRVVGWIVLKFLFLYGLVVLLLRHPAISLMGFGIGFTIILISAIGIFAVQARGLIVTVSQAGPGAVRGYR